MRISASLIGVIHELPLQFSDNGCSGFPLELFESVEPLRAAELLACRSDRVAVLRQNVRQRGHLWHKHRGCWHGR